MKALKTLGRNKVNQEAFVGDVLMSGILIVVINEKKALPKFVEVKYHAETGRSCLLVFKNRDKSRLEVAMILNESNVIIQEKSPTDIAYVIREGRVVALKVNNDREDVDRCVSQWRNVFRVVEDPESTYSIIIISGPSRSSVVQVTFNDLERNITFKYLCGELKNTVVSCTSIVQVEHLSDFELMVDVDSKTTLHFISNRPKSLYEKLLHRIDVVAPKQAPIPLAKKANEFSFYDSKQGYTPTFSERAVHAVPESEYFDIKVKREDPLMAEYLPFDRDPLISDYLPMDDARDIRIQSRDDSDEEDEDVYFDPNLTQTDEPPPRPPRVPIQPTRKISAPPTFSYNYLKNANNPENSGPLVGLGAQFGGPVPGITQPSLLPKIGEHSDSPSVPTSYAHVEITSPPRQPPPRSPRLSTPCIPPKFSPTSLEEAPTCYKEVVIQPRPDANRAFPFGPQRQVQAAEPRSLPPPIPRRTR